MRTWAVPVGHLFGMEVRVHLVFLLPFVYLLSLFQADAGRIGVLLAIVFVSVLLHQLGLAFVAAQAGATPKAVVLLPVGGIVVLNEFAGGSASATGLDRVREIRMGLLGPLIYLLVASFAAAIILVVAPELSLTTHPWIHPSALPRSVVWINLMLAAVNLIPAYPLDAGRLLRALFALRGDVMTATRRAVSVAHSLAMVLMLVGMLLYFEKGRPYSAWIGMLGFFLFLGAQLEERSVFFQSVLESVYLEEIMLTDFATLSPADTLEDALAKAVHTLQDDFPVVRGSDLVGVISRQVIVDALRAQGNGYVQGVMNRIFDVAQKRESLASAFRKLTARESTLIPVVDNEHLVGIVTLQNLMHSIGLLAESRKLKNNGEEES